MDKKNFEIAIQQKFDYFCKKVICNEVKTIRKRSKRMLENKKRYDLEQTQIFLNSQNFSTQSEAYTCEALGIKINVLDIKLSIAIDNLEEKKKEIILLFYFIGFNDEEIGKIFHMSTSGIWYQRMQAVKELRKEYSKL
ncbi:hypothetical protein IGI96_003512 [Enterococcus sp. DIV0421]|uniref:RNA polymerase sigma factor n=1 Tax=Enterococcus sp. DIV0421 TaxID=2774688 RepID=UPI003F2582C9